jgi:hypothetical protein
MASPTTFADAFFTIHPTRSTRDYRPLLARTGIGRAIELCRGSVPGMTRKRLASLVNLEESAIEDLERGSRRSHTISLGKLRQIAKHIDKKLAIDWRDPERAITCTNATTLGALFRHQAKIELDKKPVRRPMLVS